MAGIKISDLPAVVTPALTDVFPIDQGAVTYKETLSQVFSLFQANGEALTKVDDTNVTMTLGGTPATSLLNATSMTLGWTGQLAVPRGGTGNSTFTEYSVICAGTTATGAFQNVSGLGSSGQVLTSNGAAALPTWQNPPTVTPAALTRVDDTNVTLTLGGTPATALLQATSITAGWSGTLAATRGGTGTGTYTLGDILYSSATNTLAKLGGNTTTAKQYLSQTGDGVNSAAPVWSAVAAGDITGLGTMATQNATSVAITGGTINGVTIGGTTPAAGTFTTLVGTTTQGGNILLTGDAIQHVGDLNNQIVFGTDTQSFETGGVSRLDISDNGVRLGAANSRVTTILDEDDMVSDSPTALATQQSIKYYADHLPEILDANGNEVVTFSGSASAVNQIGFVNGATGVNPQILATGDDTNISLQMGGKGNGGVALVGVTNGVGFGAAYVGERVESTILFASKVSVADATATNITSVSLDAGYWIITGNGFIDCSTTGISQGFIWLSTTSATLPDISLTTCINSTAASLQNLATPAPAIYINVTTTTPVYLSCYANISAGTCGGSGKIIARRVG